MDTLRSQLAQQIERLSGATLKTVLLSLIQSHSDEHTIQVLQQAFENSDGWQAISNLAGTVDAPKDWSSEHDHYLYGTPKHSTLSE